MPTIPSPTTTIFFCLWSPLISPFFSSSATFSGSLFASGSFHSAFDMLPSFDPHVAVTWCSPGGECESPEEGSMPCVTIGSVSAIVRKESGSKSWPKGSASAEAVSQVLSRCSMRHETKARCLGAISKTQQRIRYQEKECKKRKTKAVALTSNR